MPFAFVQKHWGFWLTTSSGIEPRAGERSGSGGVLGAKLPISRHNGHAGADLQRGRSIIAPTMVANREQAGTTAARATRGPRKRRRLENAREWMCVRDRSGRAAP